MEPIESITHPDQLDREYDAVNKAVRMDRLWVAMSALREALVECDSEQGLVGPIEDERSNSDLMPDERVLLVNANSIMQDVVELEERVTRWFLFATGVPKGAM